MHAYPYVLFGKMYKRDVGNPYFVPGGFDFFQFISGRRGMRIRHSGDYSSIDDRTEKIYKRLSDLFTHPPSGAINFYVAPESKQVIAYCNQKLLFSVYPSDASLNNSEMLDLALLWLNQIHMEFYRLYDGYEGRVVNKFIGLASWYGP